MAMAAAAVFRNSSADINLDVQNSDIVQVMKEDLGNIVASEPDVEERKVKELGGE